MRPLIKDVEIWYALDMRLPDKAPHKLTEGQWGDNVSWEFYLSDEMPDEQLCTAVFCLAVLTKNPERIVLARNKRGWEMLGGHIEPGEDLEQAARREALEEGGFYVSRLRPFGYRKVIARAPIVNDHHGGYYPPVGYIPHYIATTDRELVDPSGEEILESRVFNAESLPEMDGFQTAIALAGLKAFRRQQS